MVLDIDRQSTDSLSWVQSAALKNPARICMQTWSLGNTGYESKYITPPPPHIHRATASAFRLTTCWISSGKENALHLATRSFCAILPRNSYFPLHHIGHFHVKLCSFFLFFKTCGYPADSKSSNGCYAKSQRAAQTENVTSKQDVGSYMLVHTDRLGISHWQVWWNRIREANYNPFPSLKPCALNITETQIKPAMENMGK